MNHLDNTANNKPDTRASSLGRTFTARMSTARMATVAMLLGGSAVAALAQSTPQTGATDYSLLPYTTRGYVGVNLGQANYDDACVGTGTARAFGCEHSKVSGHVYTGGMFNDYLGVEVGYVHMGRADYGNGRITAQGLNVSAVGRLPIGSNFSLFAKGGATYGRSTADNTAGIAAGSARGWGGSYGAGVGYDVSRNSTVLLEWENQDFHFSGVGRQGVQATSVGYVYRF